MGTKQQKQEMTKTVIGVNDIAKQAYETEYKARFEAWTNLLGFVRKHSNTDIELSRLYEEPSGYFMDLMKEQHGSEFPSSLRLEKILDLLEIEMHVFHDLVNKFNSYTVQLDLNSPEPVEKDWNIYARTNKEAKLFKLLTHLCEQVEKLKAEDCAIQYGNIIQGLVGAVDYDFSTQKLHPRISFIQGGGIRTNQ